MKGCGFARPREGRSQLFEGECQHVALVSLKAGNTTGRVCPENLAKDCMGKLCPFQDASERNASLTRQESLQRV